MEGTGSFGNSFSNVLLAGNNIIGSTQTCRLDFVGPVNNCRGRRFGQSLFGFTAVDTEDSSLGSYGIEALFTGADDRLEDELITYKFDTSYDVDLGFISALKAGVRVVNRENTLDAAGTRVLLDVANSVAITDDLVMGTFNHGQARSDFDGNTVLVLDAPAAIDTIFGGNEPLWYSG